MLPLKDLNPTRRLPVATYALIALNVMVFLWEQALPIDRLQAQFLNLAVVPALVTRNPVSVETALDLVRSMFLHAGWAHLLGNMLYLWLFGDNLEDRMGIPLYLAFYFVSGGVAAAAQIAIDPLSPVPMIGASGAIAGILGGYLLLFPGVRVRGIVPLGFFASVAEWPAWIVLGLWFVLQLFSGAASLGVETGSGGGVAFFAHVGGFAAGLGLTWLFQLVFPQPPLDLRRNALYERARRYRF